MYFRIDIGKISYTNLLVRYLFYPFVYEQLRHENIFILDKFILI